MQCCGSGIRIFTHPRSRISDPKTETKDRGEKKNFFQTIFCSHKFHKTEYYFIFDMLKKKIWPNFPRIIEVFTQKIVTKPSKIWVWDPGSEIRDPEKTYSGSRIQRSKRHRIRIRNTALYFFLFTSECFGRSLKSFHTVSITQVLSLRNRSMWDWISILALRKERVRTRI